MAPVSRSATARSVDPRMLRRLILQESHRAHVGHIGSSLSIADILAVLYTDVLDDAHRDDADRDIFILSKGHAALALYAALHLRGSISAEQLATYCSDDTLLGVHPERELEGIDFSTGSLGHGVSAAVGAALASKLSNGSGRAFVLASDAELNEGSTWEAIMFAAQHSLSNLTLILDLNGQQALGHTRDVIDLGDIGAKLRAFGWDVVDVDGHDAVILRAALQAPPGTAPRALAARTVAGRGVSYMEGQVAWHYLPMTDDQYRQAMSEVG